MTPEKNGRKKLLDGIKVVSLVLGVLILVGSNLRAVWLNPVDHSLIRIEEILNDEISRSKHVDDAMEGKYATKEMVDVRLQNIEDDIEEIKDILSSRR